MKDIAIRSFTPKDARQLDLFRMNYTEADLELPKGYQKGNVETAVAEKNGELVASLTGTLSIVLDPLIKNPAAAPLDVQGALLKLEGVMTYLASKHGAVDAYIAVPKQLSDYHRILRKAGYEETVQNCVVFRKPLIPDTEPLIGELRDAFFQLQSAPEVAETEPPKATQLEQSASL